MCLADINFRQISLNIAPVYRADRFYISHRVNKKLKSKTLP
jgi:hypothetical protein